jgi:hypothetical protein
MDIDLRVLKALESEKEIPFSELVEIIEGAILAAYHRTVGTTPRKDETDFTRAHLDRKSGQVQVFTREKDEEGNAIGDEVAIGHENATSSAGGTRWCSLDVCPDPNHRDHGLMIALEVDVAAVSWVSSSEPPI